MRRATLIAAALLGLLALAAGAQHLRLSAGAAPKPPPPEGALRLATHNVHYIDLRAADGPWSRAGWERRRGALAAAFEAMDADAVAFQEMESFAGGSESRDNLALAWLLERNPGFAAAAVGNPSEFPSTQPILYRRDRLEVLDQGWFFFSETPESLYARGFDGAPPSFASWARFRDRRDGAAFTLLNVHLDARSWENRRRSAELVAERAAARIADGETVLLAGDLNARNGLTHGGDPRDGRPVLPPLARRHVPPQPRAQSLRRHRPPGSRAGDRIPRSAHGAARSVWRRLAQRPLPGGGGLPAGMSLQPRASPSIPSRCAKVARCRSITSRPRASLSAAAPASAQRRPALRGRGAGLAALRALVRPLPRRGLTPPRAVQAPAARGRRV